jgi:hypothetical protein
MSAYTKEEQAQHRIELADALREGGYEQAYGQLRAGQNAFCCLGVGCDISGLGEWVGDEYVPDEDSHGSDDKKLPEPVRDYFGFYDVIGTIKLDCVSVGGGSEDALTIRNDSGEHTFAEIADAIEAGKPLVVA